MHLMILNSILELKDSGKEAHLNIKIEAIRKKRTIDKLIQQQVWTMDAAEEKRTMDEQEEVDNEKILVRGKSTDYVKGKKQMTKVN